MIRTRFRIQGVPVCHRIGVGAKPWAVTMLGLVAPADGIDPWRRGRRVSVLMTRQDTYRQAVAWATDSRRLYRLGEIDLGLWFGYPGLPLDTMLRAIHDPDEPIPWMLEP